MLLEIGVGDAYGVGFEYCDANLPHNTLRSYVKRTPEKAEHWPASIGHYSDDTQMSLAIAELLVEGADWTPLNIATKFVVVFKRDPIVGYARNFFAFLNKIKDGQEFLDKIKPDSDKSGAAMRAMPIGVLSSKKDVLEYATVQARLTHNTPDGVRAACASALTTHYFLYERGLPVHLPKYIAENVEHGDNYAWDVPYEGPVGSKGHMSVRAAITAVAQNTSMAECLKQSIAFSGDVDTVAAIAMAASSCCDIYTKDLPEFLLYSLQDGKYGRRYLIELDQKLMSLVRR